MTGKAGHAGSTPTCWPRSARVIAGTLGEIFTMDITSAERICQSCGTQAAIGAHGATRERALPCAALPAAISPLWSASWVTADAPENPPAPEFEHPSPRPTETPKANRSTAILC
jgi:Family of unknown function (DUF6510)